MSEASKLREQVRAAQLLDQHQRGAHAQIEHLCSSALQLASNAADIGVREALLCRTSDPQGENVDGVLVLISGPIPPAVVATLETIVNEHRAHLLATGRNQVDPAAPAGPEVPL